MSDQSQSEPLIPELNRQERVLNPTRSFVYILFVTVIIGGLQLSWSAEFSNGTPYLLSLGMSKTLMSLVWIAGPLSGSIGQPVIGALSDRSKSKFGRRRPFIVGGGLATIVSLLALAWSVDIVGLFSRASNERELKRETIPLAVCLVYLLDFSIAAIQASARAYMVDNVPTEQQQESNAWAAKMTGIGNIIGFILGSANLPKVFPFLGNTQFKVLSACASIGLVLTVVPAIMYVSERQPSSEPEDDSLKRNTSILWSTVHAIQHLSPQTKTVCSAQFFAWIGYFPMLFYTSTYVGDLYRREHENADDWESATRKGSLALLLFSISSLIANFILPLLVKSRQKDPLIDESLSYLGRFSVARIWTFSHVLFIICMAATFLVSTANQATTLFAVLGICWAVALWAPFTLISEEIARLREESYRHELTGASIHYVHEPGVVLGIHNLFIAAPQVVSSLMSSVLFKIFSEGDSVAWVFRFGGLAAIVAAYISLFVKDDYWDED